MAKRKDSPYEPGLRSASWLKIKAKKTCDCVIAGYTLGQGGRGPSFGSLLLGLYENEGGGEPQAKRTSRSLPASSPVSKDTGSSEKRLVYIGKVGSGFTDRDLADLMEVFAKLETAVPQMQGVGQDDRVAWLEPALVCEVAYQEVTRDRKLRIPRFIRLRSGKRPEDCTLDQLADAEVHPGPAGTEIRDKNQPETGRGGPSVSIPGRGERPRGPGQKGASPEQPMKKYHEKRNFSVTNEPKGTMKMKGEGNYFVVQEHRSHKLHYDLRLEREGVLKSWAVPKGIPESAGEKHLAVAVEDHPLDYGHFEGTIPEGEYGAGTVTIWDNGTYDTRHWDDEKIEVAFHGKRLTGYYVLVRFKRAGKNEWLVFKAVG
jgi:DNA ligase D-like protein (predicted 3'-phosphoesterase)